MKKMPKVVDIKVFLISLLFVFLVGVISCYIDSNSYYVGNKTDFILNESNNLNSSFKDKVKMFFNSILFSPRGLLSSNYIDLVSYNKTDYNDDSYLRKDKKYKVYIYNTHQREEYKANSNEMELSGLSFTVLTASYILKENLYKKGIYSIVEETDVRNILNTNNWAYSKSYDVTRGLLERVVLSNSDLCYFIDLHRDSVSRKISTIQIGDKSYARVMFLLGLENPNYQDNLVMMEYFNNYLNDNYPGLSRGIYKKSGKGVNGVYNQDFHKNTILIEVGGYENSIDEVNNSLEIIADVLSLYMKEGDDE